MLIFLWLRFRWGLYSVVYVFILGILKLYAGINFPVYLSFAGFVNISPLCILLYLFCAELGIALGKPVETGEFGADMQVELLNDGPVTICMDTKNKE